MGTWIGIDIGKEAVKVAVLRSAYRKLFLDAFVSVDIVVAPSAGPFTTPASAPSVRTLAVSASSPSVKAAAASTGTPVVPDEVTDVTTEQIPANAAPDVLPAEPLPVVSPVAAAIRVALGAAQGGRIASGDGVGVSISGAMISVHSVNLPMNVYKQAESVLPFELDAEVPFDMEGSVFDFRGGVRAAGGKSLPVLVVVARTDDVRARIDVVREAVSIEPEWVGAGAFALANGATYMPSVAEGDSIAIIDLGADSTDVLILRNGEPAFARTLSHSAFDLSTARGLLARELRVTIAGYQASGGKAPSIVYLCGGGATLPSIAEWIGSELRVPVELLPAPRLEIDDLPAERLAELPRFAKAISIALGVSARGKGFNLRRGVLAYERGFGWLKEKIPVLAGLAAVIFVSFLFSGFSKLFALSKEREVLEKALAIVTREVLGEETSIAARANELLSHQAAVNDEDPMPHADAFDVMVKLSEDIPASITHDIDELDVQKGHVVIHGIVGSIPEAQLIATALQNERCLSDVKITRTNQVVGGERQKYVLELDLKCPEDVKGGGKKKDSSSSGTSGSSGGGGAK